MDKEDVARMRVHIHTRAHTRTCVHTHTQECYSTVKKNETMPFSATWVNIEIIIHMKEARQRKTNII